MQLMSEGVKVWLTGHTTRIGRQIKLMETEVEKCTDTGKLKIYEDEWLYGRQSNNIITYKSLI